MRLALLVLWILAPDLRALQLYERMAFQPATATDDAARRVAEILEKKEHWVGAYSLLGDKFGPFPDDLVVTVDFDHRGEELAQASVRKARATISFNLAKLAVGQRSLDEFYAKKKAAEARGNRLELKIPPVKVDRIIYHELLHVLQQGSGGPLWFVEGMAQLAGDDPNSIYGFMNDKKSVRKIDAALDRDRDAYARGHLFWKWLDSRGVVQRVFELSVVKRIAWKDALVEATQLSWDVLVDMEREWSQQELEKLR